MAQFEYTFPQDWGTGSHPQYVGSPNDAANFGALIGSTNPVAALIRGITFTVDYANNTVDTTAGKVYLVGDNITAGTSQTERDEVGFVNGVKAKTGLTLTDAALNHVYVATDPATNNEPRVEINDTGTPPTDPSLKIGEIDTSGSTKSEQWNLVAGNGMLTYPDNAALTDSATKFSNGVPLFDRGTEKLSIVDSSGVSSVTPVTDHANLSNITADDHHTAPTAGSFIVDEGTNQFGANSEEFAYNNPVTTPIVGLQAGESYEITMPLRPGDTLTVYGVASGYPDPSAGTSGIFADTNLVAEVVDEDDTVLNSASGESSWQWTNKSYTNNQSVILLYKLRIKNTSSSTTFDSPGAFAAFAISIEQ